MGMGSSTAPRSLIFLAPTIASSSTLAPPVIVSDGSPDASERHHHWSCAVLCAWWPPGQADSVPSLLLTSDLRTWPPGIPCVTPETLVMNPVALNFASDVTLLPISLP